MGLIRKMCSIKKKLKYIFEMEGGPITKCIWSQMKVGQELELYQ